MCLCTPVNRQVGIQKTPSLHVAMEMQCNRGSKPVWMWVGGWVGGRVCSVFVVLVSCIVCLCTRHWVLRQPYQVKFNRKDRGVWLRTLAVGKMGIYIYTVRVLVMTDSDHNLTRSIKLIHSHPLGHEVRGNQWSPPQTSDTSTISAPHWWASTSLKQLSVALLSLSVWWLRRRLAGTVFTSPSCLQFLPALYKFAFPCWTSWCTYSHTFSGGVSKEDSSLEKAHVWLSPGSLI